MMVLPSALEERAARYGIPSSVLKDLAARRRAGAPHDELRRCSASPTGAA